MHDSASLEQALNDCEALHRHYASLRLSLDITRGKPAAEQLSLANDLLQAVDTTALTKGNDLRNYGILDGLPEAKTLFGELLGIPEEERQQRVLVGGNSSLSLMHYTLMFANYLGLSGGESWSAEARRKDHVTKILCPCPGYDRHFALCEELGIEMITVPLTGSGPDMEQVEALVRADESIKGIWCVPRFSNPTGEVYNDETVRRLASLPSLASENFYVLWDNAYAVHTLSDKAPALANIDAIAGELDTRQGIIQFGSTSKITFAGAGIGYMGSSADNIRGFTQHFGKASIGSDKINQYRHINFLKNHDTIAALMSKHADIIRPKFAITDKILSEHFADNDMGEWLSPEGGYFISFNTRPGLARQVVQLAADVGVKLTPAGATFPLGIDPNDKNIRIAPTYPGIDEVKQAVEVFANCVKLASYRQQLAARQES